MSPLLMQVTTTPQERLSGIRERLSEGGGTWGDLGLLLIGLAALLLVLHIAFGLQRRRGNESDDSRKLFRSLISDLGLSVRQRDLLCRMARDLRLQEPAVLLIAPAAYRSQTERWSREFARNSPAVQAEINRLATALFSPA